MGSGTGPDILEKRKVPCRKSNDSSVVHPLVSSYVVRRTTTVLPLLNSVAIMKSQPVNSLNLIKYPSK